MTDSILRSSQSYSTTTIVPFPVPAVETWDTTNFGGPTVFSNGNLTGTSTGIGVVILRSQSQTIASQKMYAEFTQTFNSGNGQIGIWTGTGTPPSGGGTNTPSTGAAYLGGGRFSCQDSADHFILMTPAWATGDQVDMAVDTSLSPPRMWARVNNGAWNSVTGGDPVAGTGGGRIPFSPPYYIQAEVDDNTGASFTARFASGSWLHTAPTGYTEMAP